VWNKKPDHTARLLKVLPSSKGIHEAVHLSFDRTARPPALVPRSPAHVCSTAVPPCPSLASSKLEFE
jgi:hypothetical protein